MWPTFAAELLAARASLRLGEEIGLALRAERHRLGMSQRTYAAHRGWTLSTVIRLESSADGLKLGDIVDALSGTAFVLTLCHRPPTDDPAPAMPSPDTPNTADQSVMPASAAPVPPPPATAAPTPEPQPEDDPHALPQPVHPAFWPQAELIARVRGGSRRFPAHHVTERSGGGPPWWWYAESSRAGTVAPDWYAPRFTQRRNRAS